MLLGLHVTNLQHEVMLLPTVGPCLHLLLLSIGLKFDDWLPPVCPMLSRCVAPHYPGKYILTVETTDCGLE